MPYTSLSNGTDDTEPLSPQKRSFDSHSPVAVENDNPPSRNPPAGGSRTSPLSAEQYGIPSIVEVVSLLDICAIVISLIALVSYPGPYQH